MIQKKQQNHEDGKKQKYYKFILRGVSMDSWRNDIALILKHLTGKNSQGWRSDIANIARYYEIHPTGWRFDLSSLAKQNNVNTNSWRSILHKIALSYGFISGKGWRDDLRNIRIFIEGGKPPEPTTNRLIDVNGLFVIDNLNRQMIIVGDGDYISRHSGSDLDNAVDKAISMGAV